MADGNLEFNTKLDTSGFSSGIATLGKLTAVGLTAVATALGVGAGAVVKFGSEFESGMAKVSTLVDTTQVDMSKMSAGILELSSKTGKGANEMSEAMYQALSAGVDAGKSLEFLEQANKLATAGFTTTEGAVDALTTVLNSYGMSADQAESMSDMLMMTQNKGKTTVDELAGSLAQVTPLASTMSVGFDQVSASLATMTAQGMPTAEATTKLKTLIAELGKEGTQANTAMMDMYEKMGYGRKSFKQLMDEGVTLNDIITDMEGYAGENGKSLLDMFGSIEGGQAAMSLAGDNAVTFANNLEAMRSSSGTTGDAFDKMSDTFDYKVGVMKESAKNFGISLYTGIQEPLKGLADVGIESIDKLKTSFEENGLQGMLETGSQLFVQLLNGILQKMPDAIIMASGIITTILTTISEMAPDIANAGAQILTQLVTAILENLPILLECCIELVIALANGIAEQLPTLVPVAMQAIIDFANTLLQNAPRILEAGKNLLFGLIDGIMNAIPILVANAPTIIMNLITALLQMLPSLFSTGAEILVHIISGIGSMVWKLGEMALTLVASLWDNIKNTDWMKLGVDLLKNFISGIFSMFGGLGLKANGIVDIVINAVSSLPSKMLNVGKNIVAGIWDGISGGVGWLMDQISGFVDDVVDGICDFFDIFSPSHRMRDEVGKYLPSGIAVGYEKAMPNATDDMIDATDSGFKDLQKSAFEMSNKVTLQPQATSPENKSSDFDYERLGKEVAKHNDKVIVMDGKEVGKTVTDTVDKQIGKETVKKGRYRA